MGCPAGIRRLHRRRVYVDLQVLVDARVRTRFESFIQPQVLDLLGGPRQGCFWQPSSICVRDVRRPDNGGSDGRSELACVVKLP